MRKLGIFVTLIVAMTFALLPNLSVDAQGGDDFRNTFDIEGPAEDGDLAGVDPSGETVVYWHNHSGGREEQLNELVAEFNSDNPWGITVEASNQGGYGDIYNKVVAGLTTGELPNLVVAYQNQSAAYDIGGAVVNMDTYVQDGLWGLNEAEQADFIQAFFGQDVVNDFRLGFPPNRSLEALYYNASALEELGYDGPPTTWEEFADMACTFTEEGWSGAPGDTVGYSIRTDASFIAASTYALDGDIYDAENDTYNYNNEETATALSFMKGLMDDGCANLIAERFGDQNDFAAGTNLFYVGSTSGLPFVLSGIEESNEEPFEWGVAYLPYAEAPVVNIYGASVTMLATEDTTLEEQLATWLFVRWFTEAEQQGRWAAASNYFPVRISTTENLDGIFEEIPQYEQAWELLLNAEGAFEPSAASYDIVRREAQAAFEIILAEDADVEATLETLDETANTIQVELEAEGEE